MASGTNYSQEYAQAEKAYLQGNFTQAAEIIDRLVEEFSDNPNVLLLRGHIYCYGFQNYELAQQLYESVLELSQEQGLLDFAYNGIEQVQQLQKQAENDGLFEQGYEMEELDNNNWDSANFQEGEDLIDASSKLNGQNDFSFSEEDNEDAFANFSISESENESLDELDNDDNYELPELSFEEEGTEIVGEINESSSEDDIKARPSVHNSSTFMVDDEEESDDDEDYLANSLAEFEMDNNFVEENEVDDNSEIEIDTVLTEPFAIDNSGGFNIEESSEQYGLDYQDELEFDEIDSSFFDLEELEQGLPDTGLFNVSQEETEDSPSLPASEMMEYEDSSFVNPSSAINPIENSIDNSQLEMTAANDSDIEPVVEVKQGAFSGFANSSIKKKLFVTALSTGIVSAIAVGIVTKGNLKEQVKLLPLSLISLVAGGTSFSTAMIFGTLINKQIQQAADNLQSQFEDVYQGNLNAKATVYSQDEFGKLATGFNRMTRVILTTTQEAQRRAEETEQAKEDLQRQVIRLLDDVEGAARGDLTVQATVTADVLGAVADAFNLTIQSLREIVRQVKQAAEQVNKSSTDSELFARNQSSEALRMAEELAVTLNSVQMMTESIERVAENAREAEEVARSSSVTALRGGKAVESTVAGIFQIRETVSETARKVKRLAEASQEISKIVLIISQIAERTNQLALNASIQAAKAGEAGRGFAVVADEVRQLADRSGKSLKEIEQIVLQIQSETGSVMTAMEEGIQEVIEVTDRADQAKTALEDIIQVSNRIDTLVRSITADTVEQRENSRAVAQVMQSVELTAQATSQESQRVAGSLQSLVSIARDLLSSVERFRIEKDEE
ncbi:methyl-accepting chemotaxis protein [Xenococcus sp. PCC 7305]|uniref:methyl-accepting chemotaxis protein n=1 Tax=Xenococcus sp. PCC 7305 TaxID=102125 RepID=UPI0002AC6454|nr:methyl-accepting chemotaxis protein [Xenococcus sp. PCC 7305]ELS04990.1 methyl-accepting chemotaxis protein [Xenococcus sp. PCC 7305]